MHEAPRRTAWLIALLLLGASPLRAQDTATEIQSLAPAAPGQEALEESRKKLRAATDEPGVLTYHATTLLEAGDTSTLGAVLESGAGAAQIAVLNAVKAAGSDALLLPALHLAVTGEPAVARPSRAYLAALVRRPDVQFRLIARLEEGTAGAAELATIVGTLGECACLTPVPRLIELLDASLAPHAAEALVRLTGYRPDPLDDQQAWRAFWAAHQNETRELMLEQALTAEREASVEKLQAKDSEIEQLLLDQMGQDVEPLKASLASTHAGVRLEAARRLGAHKDLERASTAVPVLLRRLGHAANGTADAAGSTNGRNGDGSEVATETDPVVRAEVVAALGKLGRDDDAVRGALVDELRRGPARQAAAHALSYVSGRPAIVPALLDYLADEPAPVEDEVVEVLQTVARNRPTGVLQRLSAWLDPARSARVRAAGLGAVLASDEIGPALAVVEELVLPQGEGEVELRYTAAAGLGDSAQLLRRAITPPPANGTPATGVELEGEALVAAEASLARVVELLAPLLQDGDASVRAAAAKSLGRSGSAAALALLQARADVESVASVTVHIVAALGELGLLEAVPALGRITAAAGAEAGTLVAGALTADAQAVLDAGQEALAQLGEDADAARWLAMADTLRDVKAWSLAALAYDETARRFGQEPESRDLVDQARGRLAETLMQAGRFTEALPLLEELHQADRPLPPRLARLEMLATAASALEDHAAAADWWLERVQQSAEGERDQSALVMNAVRELRLARRSQEALPLNERLLLSDPSNNDVLAQHAQILYELGEWEKAVETAVRVVNRLGPDDQQQRLDMENLIQSCAPVDEPASPEPGTGDASS